MHLGRLGQVEGDHPPPHGVDAQQRAWLTRTLGCPLPHLDQQFLVDQLSHEVGHGHPRQARATRDLSPGEPLSREQGPQHQRQVVLTRVARADLRAAALGKPAVAAVLRVLVGDHDC